jgi:hypothetical protein
MTLVRLELVGEKDDRLTVTADKLTDHFAMHPAIMVDTDTGEKFLNPAVWSLTHIASGKEVVKLYQEDPIECPGEPRAVDPDVAAEFAKWLEQQTNWDAEVPNVSTDVYRQLFLYQGGINHWAEPPACDKCGKPNAITGTRMGVKASLCHACENNTKEP